MKCPYCDSQLEDWQGAHRHLVEEHLQGIELAFDDEHQQMYYRVACPLCDHAIRKVVRPRSTDVSFLEEYRREISLVAFDLLLYHVSQTHPELFPEVEPTGTVTHIPLVQE